MLIRAVETYLAVRRAAGFALRSQGSQLRSFAAFSKARKQHYVSTDIASEWAGLAPSVPERVRRLGPSSDSPAISVPRTDAMRYRQRFSVRRGQHDRLRTF